MEKQFISLARLLRNVFNLHGFCMKKHNDELRVYVKKTNFFLKKVVTILNQCYSKLTNVFHVLLYWNFKNILVSTNKMG